MPGLATKGGEKRASTNLKSQLDPEFGVWLKRTRLNKKLKVRDLSELAGLGQSTLTELENGHKNHQALSVELFQRVANGLGLDFGYVLHKAGFPVGATGVNLARLARMEAIVESFAQGEHTVRKGLAEALRMAQAQPPLFDSEKTITDLGLALGAFDLITERLHEEDAL